jgi:hypothetical protein
VSDDVYTDMLEDDPDCLEGTGRTREQMIADRQELDRVAPTPADKFALMFGHHTCSTAGLTTGTPTNTVETP